jgi:hypothetical protein
MLLKNVEKQNVVCINNKGYQASLECLPDADADDRN